jgi:competence protein ComEC
MAGPLNDTSSEFYVHVIDVGQGDSILLEGPDGDTILVDSGSHTDSGETVRDYLDEHDIDHLNHLVASPYDADHIGGHAAIIEEFGPDNIETVHGPDISGVKDSNSDTMKEYLRTLVDTGLTENELREGTNLHLNSVDIDVLNPFLDSDSKDRNENILCALETRKTEDEAIDQTTTVQQDVSMDLSHDKDRGLGMGQ